MFSKKIVRYSVILGILSAPAAFADDAMPGADSHKTHMSKDAQRQAMLARAGKIIGTNVYNNAGESLGEINELVLDGSENRIGYAVLSYGGLLGIGDKLFAIPWTQFEQRGTDKNKLYLNIAQDQLKNAPGFDKNKWPESADRSYWQSVDKYYPNRVTEPDAMKLAPNPNDTAAPANANTPKEDGLAWTRKVSSVIGADVQNASNENLGDIKDLVIDTTNGQVRYAVVSFGGWLGIGDKLFAVPMKSLQGASGREYFVMNVTKDQMKNAPGFDDKSWPDFADPKWGTANDAFYHGDGKDDSKAARNE